MYGWCKKYRCMHLYSVRHVYASLYREIHATARVTLWLSAEKFGLACQVQIPAGTVTLPFAEIRMERYEIASSFSSYDLIAEQSGFWLATRLCEGQLWNHNLFYVGKATTFCHNLLDTETKGISLLYRYTYIYAAINVRLNGKQVWAAPHVLIKPCAMRETHTYRRNLAFLILLRGTYYQSDVEISI